MEVYPHSKEAWRNHSIGFPCNIEGFGDIKNIITLVMGWGIGQYYKCHSSKSIEMSHIIIYL